MKKNMYQSPTVEVIGLAPANIIATSNTSGETNVGNSGTTDSDARSHEFWSTPSFDGNNESTSNNATSL